MLITALVLWAFLAGSAIAEETKGGSLEGIEFLTGFSWGNLREQKDYRAFPILVDFDFNLKQLTKKFNFNPPQLFQFQFEPFITVISQPRSNIETGTSFLLKFGLLPQTCKFQPYLKGGMGLVYLSLHTREQKTQFNFTEQVGAGMHYFFAKNTAFTCEYRYRHLSNAGIKHPNRGINTHTTIIGVAHNF